MAFRVDKLVMREDLNMLHHKNHLIRENKPIDYYVWRYPGMLRAFYQCMNGECPLEPYDNDIEKHIQMVIAEHNSEVRQIDARLSGKAKPRDYLYA